MSDADGQPSGQPYDSADLGRLIAVSFSTPELRQLAEALGVGGSLSWNHGPQEAVRDLVREFERYYGLGTLVAKLKELRPLIDWPDPEALPPLAGRAPGAAELPPEAPADDSASSMVSAASADPLQLSTKGASPKQPSVESAAPPSVPAPSAPGAASAPPASRAAPVWPGTVASLPEPATGSKGLDPRVLILVASLTVLAAVIAYAAGRASNGPPTAQATPEAASSAVAVPTLRRPPGPATHAAGAIARSLANVAKLCELPSDAEPTAALLARAFERCGTPPRLVSTIDRLPMPSPRFDPPRDPPADPSPNHAKPARPTKPTPAPAQPGGADAACLGRCASDSRACYSACGTEPTQSSQYDGYMRCRSRCMSALSRCRLACPQR